MTHRFFGTFAAAMLFVTAATLFGTGAGETSGSDGLRAMLGTSVVYAQPEGPDEPTTPVRISDLREQGEGSSLAQRAVSLLGIFGLLGIAWLMSSERRKIPWRVIGYGVGLQVLFGVLILKTSPGLYVFQKLNDGATRLLAFTDDGAKFIFGAYYDLEFSFALRVLPTIIFFSALMSVLYHLGVIDRVVRGICWLMQVTMKTSGAETLSAAANIFVGQTEAPLVVRPFVDKMTRSELMAVMVGGFATVAGGVLAAYVAMLKDQFPDIAGHLIAASVMSAPAALVVAKVMVPETETPETDGQTKFAVERTTANLVDAAAQGAGDGVKLALNVGAMLLAFLALLALINFLIGVPVDAVNQVFGLTGEAAFQPWSLEQILGGVLYPVALLMGVDPGEAATVASLLGEKMVLTEFVAYQHLGTILTDGAGSGQALSYRSIVIATYSLCGFANFGSIGIQIGGIGGIAPGRRAELASLGLRAMLGGTLAACMTGAVAGALL